MTGFILFSFRMDDPDGSADSAQPLVAFLKCPLCPVRTNSIQRHLRLCHRVKDAKKAVKKTGKCRLCSREVSSFPSHVKGYHKIDAASNLSHHLVQLARYGFDEGPEIDSSESGSDSPDEEERQARDMFDQFKVHLMGIDGGMKSEETAKQHINHVSQVAAEAGIGIFSDLGPLMQPGGFLHKHWKEPEVTGKSPWRPGTLKSYLYSLRLFLEFCLIAEKHVPADRCEAGIQRIGRWINSLKNETKLRRQELYEEQADQLMGVEELASFYSCQSHLRAVDFLNSVRQTGDVGSQAILSSAADDLLLWILLDNGPRSGALLNATVSEFRQVRNEGGERIMSVKKHKNFATQGACHLVLSNQLFECLQTWVEVIHPVLKSRAPEEMQSDNIFLDIYGRAITRKKGMKRLEVYAEEVLGTKITATLIRKSLINMVSPPISLL